MFDFWPLGGGIQIYRWAQKEEVGLLRQEINEQKEATKKNKLGKIAIQIQSVRCELQQKDDILHTNLSKCCE